MSYLSNPKGCKVAIVGTGISGQSAARLLDKLGARVTLFDESAGAELAKDALSGFDFAVLSPGFPRRKKAVAHAIASGIMVVNEIDVGAAQLPECRFIGVTGTNGKSTTTAMIGEVLKRVDPEAFVGGNLGTPLCDVVFEGRSPKFGVIELSSYQLETVAHVKLDIAVVTHLTPDHLDRYETVEDYYAAKDRIFDLLKPNGAAVINQLDPNSAHYLHPRKGHRVIGFNSPLEFELPNLVGAHNLANAAAAFAATKAFGVANTTIEAALKDFKGLAHRLEFIGEHRGVRWFNDSKATNVESSMIAVQSFDRGVHLILGGLGKGSSYAPLVSACTGRVKCVYTIGDDAPLIERECEGRLSTFTAHTLEKAIDEATSRAVAGDVIVLSPACASFDQYPGYAARGDHLKELFSKHKQVN